MSIYDYYIEPCQLCISRNGDSYDSCEWCQGTDTHYKKSDDTYAGDWISILYGGNGYLFHELPHPTRQYYKDNKVIEFSDGKLPSDVSAIDVKKAIERNAIIEKEYKKLRGSFSPFSNARFGEKVKPRKEKNIFKFDSFKRK